MKGTAEPRGLAKIGLASHAPCLMGRYKASLRAEMARLGLATPKMRALAMLSVIDRPLIREFAVHAVMEQSTLSRALDGIAAEERVRREGDAQDARGALVTIAEEGRAAFERLWASDGHGT